MKFFSCLLGVILGLAIVFAVVCVEAFIGMIIFNWVMGLLGISLVASFWQAFGVCLLLSFVGGFFRGRAVEVKNRG